MLTMDTKEALKQRAIEVGFDLVAVAPVKPGRDLEFAREWVERGFGGEMDYLANPRRFDPRAVLSSVRSAVCVGLIYNTPFPYSTEARQAEVRSQESEARNRKPVVSAQSSAKGHDGQRTTDNAPRPVSNFQFPDSRTAEPRAWISRYAWGSDYHEIMREKLGRLGAAIEQLAPGVETRVYVDTGPVVERAFARFSGLGWMGKNTCIINEEKGSWFFLGVILTNLELEPDLPAPDRCGSCRACLDACPTGALVEPYVMDASRCISYLTIELKGSIPREFRPDVGVNIFGCDICQDVCPWNSKGRFQVSGAGCQESSFLPLTVDIKKLEIGNWKLETGNAEFNPSPRAPAMPNRQLTTDNGQTEGVANRQSSIDNRQSSTPSTQHLEPSTFSLFNPPLEALASLTEDDFRRIFAHSPIKRAKYHGWLRNLCVAMGNSGDARFVPWLERALAHPDPIVREHAEWALNRITRQS